MKNKILLYILIFIIALVSFFAFFSKKPDENKDTTIVFWTLQLGTFDKYINGIIADFEKENPNVKIKWIDVPYSEGEKRTLAAVLTDNPPDLVNLTPDFSLILAQKNALYTFNKEELSDYLPSLINMLKYNDKYYGIPFYATSAVTLYNKSLIKNNKLPKTYDDLFKINNLNTYLTMINLSENDTLLKLLNKYNINTPQTISSKESTELFSQLKELYNSGKIPKESITQSHREALEKYMAGQIVFLVTGANFINMIKENAPSVYKATDVLPQLIGPTKAYDYSLMNFVIPKKSKNPELALKFAQYFTNEKNQLKFAKMTTILPVNKAALNDEFFTKNNSNDIQDKARIISAKQLNNLQKPLSNIKNKKELNTISSNYVQEILINNKNINDTLQKFSADWQKL